MDSFSLHKSAPLKQVVFGSCSLFHSLLLLKIAFVSLLGDPNQGSELDENQVGVLWWWFISSAVLLLQCKLWGLCVCWEVLWSCSLPPPTPAEYTIVHLTQVILSLQCF